MRNMADPIKLAAFCGLLICILSCAGGTVNESQSPDGDLDSPETEIDISEIDMNEAEYSGDQEREAGGESQPSECLFDSKYIPVNPGLFVMGVSLYNNLLEQESAKEGSLARYLVDIKTPYAIRDKVITENEFRAVMNGDVRRIGDGIRNAYNSNCDGGCCPAIFVSISEAMLFLNDLSARENLPKCFTCEDWDELVYENDNQRLDEHYECRLNEKYERIQDCPGYRLPTSAEWEYAARAGKTNSYPGNDINICNANTNCGTDISLDSDGTVSDYAWYCQEGFHPVGTKMPNAWGLYDMLGNTMQYAYDAKAWPTKILLEDYYTGYVSGSDVLTDPVFEPQDGFVYDTTERAFRGSWYNEEISSCRIGIVRSVSASAHSSLRPVRTISLEEAADGVKLPDDYEYKETSIETATQKAPSESATPNGFESPTPQLSWVNPWPTSEIVMPLGVFNGRLWLGGDAGTTLWPAVVTNADAYRSSTGLGVVFDVVESATEAWDRMWVGNCSGGIRQARDGNDRWQTVTERNGGRPFDMEYDPSGDRLIGWYYCDLFLRYSDDRSATHSYYEDYFLNDAATSALPICNLEGEHIEWTGRLANFQDRIYLYARLYRKQPEDGLSISGALFVLDGDYWILTAEHPIADMKISEHPGTIEALAAPLEFQGMLLLAGATETSGILLAYDGSQIQEFADVSAPLGPRRIWSMASLNDNKLYMSSGGKVLSLEDGVISDEWNFMGNKLVIKDLFADKTTNTIFISGARGSVSDSGKLMYQSLLLGKKEGGDWREFNREIFGKGGLDAPPLSTLDFGSNGKGLAAGLLRGECERFEYGTIMRFDGAQWYKWTEKSYPVEDVVTQDGDTAWFISSDAAYRISDSEGVVKEETPYTRGKLFLGLIKGDEDGEIYIVGEYGLIFKRSSDGWEDVSIEPTWHLFDGLMHDGDLWIIGGDFEFVPDKDGEDSIFNRYVHAGRKILRLRNNGVLLINTPEEKYDFVVSYIVGNSYVEGYEYNYYFKQSLLAEDSNGSLWLGRNDGAWKLNSSGGWDRYMDNILPEGEAMTAFFACGDGMCLVSTQDIYSPYYTASFMHVIEPDGGGAYKSYRRNLVYGQHYHRPLAGARLSDNRSVIVGTHGMIMEYGNWLPLPVDIDKSTYGTYEYPDDFDEDAFYGTCVSSQTPEAPQCDDTKCAIPAGQYCLGATRAADDHGVSEADDYPAKAKNLAAFSIDKVPVRRGNYIEFVNSQPESERKKFYPMDVSDPHYRSVYGLDCDENATCTMGGDSSLAVDFASQYGAEAYCAEEGKRLCSPEEWEAACRGFDDDFFPWGDFRFSGGVIPKATSDFGVEEMGLDHYEIVSGSYYHDWRRYDTPLSIEGDVPILKGGTNTREIACWASSPLYPSFFSNKTKISFRCCQ